MTKKVLVTGGAGVIGLAICRQLRVYQWSPIAGDLPEALSAVDWTNPDNRHIKTIELDVTNRDSIEGAAKQLGHQESLAGLVNCAGVLRDTFLGKLNEKNIELMFQVNIAGTARVTDVFAPLLNDGGAIVNIGSVTGQIGRFIGASVYGATKAGIAAYTVYLAAELADRKIRVNNIAPGVIRAPMSPSMAAVSGGEERSASHAMLGRIGEPEEVADAVEFMLSERSSFITGQTLLVDGGFVAL